MAKFNEMTYGELIKHVDGAIKALRQKAYGEGYAQGKFDAELDRIYRLSPEELTDEVAQDIRDRIVERAKRDVEQLTRHTARAYNGNSGISYQRKVVRERFVVNRLKRTVVCLIEGAVRGARGVPIFSRGIAKAHPNDCFNVHIGKAIALRRALGLNVPDDYLDAPQPTEVRVGDIVEYDTVYGKKRSKVENNGAPIRGRFHAKSRMARKGTIVDDSREEVD